MQSNRIDRACEDCGGHFTTIPSRVRDGRGKFCSRTCLYNSQRGTLPTTVYVERICQRCGKVFSLPARLLKSQSGEYCSRLCANRAKANPTDPVVRERKAKLVSITSKERWQSPEFREKIIKARQGASKKRWQDPKFVAKMLKALNKKPTKPEKRLGAILDKHLPQFQYNGDFSLGILLGGLIPDFINVNGKKEVIELFGDYFHSPEVIGDNWHRSELGKVMLYNSLGYRCLVIWEHELNELSEDELVERISDFFSKSKGGKKHARI